MELIFEDEEKKKDRHILREIIIWIICLALSVLAGYLVITYAVEKTTVIGESMEPTMSEGEKIIVNKLAYKFMSIKRDDVIVFKKENSFGTYYDIKRVIALPGDSILIKKGKIYVNGEEYTENLKVEEINNPGLAAEEIKLSDDEYFVLGDNRNKSEDSRFASVALIKREDIAGKAWIRLKPFGFVSQLNRKDDKEQENAENQGNAKEKETENAQATDKTQATDKAQVTDKAQKTDK